MVQVCGGWVALCFWVWVLDARGLANRVCGFLGGFRLGDCGLSCFLPFWW